MSGDLCIQEAFDVPLAEISGLALQRTPGQPERLLAIGDESFEVVAATLDGGSVGEAFERHDLFEHVRYLAKKGGSQWEAIACDAAGRVLVLQENPGHVFVFDPTLTKLLLSIELSADEGGAAADWATG